MEIIWTLSSIEGDGNESIKTQWFSLAKPLAQHVRDTLWYFSLPSSTKQQRESFEENFIIQGWIFLSVSLLYLKTAPTNSAPVQFGHITQIKWFEIIAS